LDIVSAADELLMVMDYVEGVPLSSLLSQSFRAGAAIPPPIASAIVCDVLQGLHAAHEAHDDDGRPLGIVHRDVSPQNVLVGVDGVSRVCDFGVAKAAGRMSTTGTGTLKGKLEYMAPEQLRGTVSTRTDVYAAGIVLWELLAQRRLFVAGDGEGIDK